MFLPNDLTNDEKDLVAEVHRQLVASEPAPTSARARQVQRHRAEEIAAEMIFQGRSSASSTMEDTDPPTPVTPLDGTRTEQELLEEDLADVEAEREQEYLQYLASQRPEQ